MSMASGSGYCKRSQRRSGKRGIITSSSLISSIYFGRNFLKRWLIVLDEDPNSACETCTARNEFWIGASQETDRNLPG